MYGLEDARPLSLIEKNSRKIVKTHLAKVLEAKRIYWKQRAIVRFGKFGKENTKVFHALATHTKRKNHITQLQLANGSCVMQHSEKVDALWESFKNRLGSSVCPIMHFDLSKILQNVTLPVLDNAFTMEEIQAALNDMPIDHAPSPDGFNGMFMKKCSPIIQEDFMRFFAQFHSGNLNIEAINGCYITLVPKEDCSSIVNDYRPISLLNRSLKLLTNIIANRLQ
jgi:hypothetical protein